MARMPVIDCSLVLPYRTSRMLWERQLISEISEINKYLSAD